jgi:hexosaminidase
VRTLVDVVEPVKVYQRGSMREHTRHTPLTRLVDAARPDSREARRMAWLVNALLAEGNAPAGEALRTTFAAWRRAGNAVAVTSAQSPLLAYALPLARDLATVGRIGEEALAHMAGAAPAGWAENALAALDAAAKPKAEVELVVVETVRRLVLAASGRR